MSDKQQQQQQEQMSRAEEMPNTSGIAARIQASALAGSNNSDVFKQLFATLEAEHQKLNGLEKRRLKLTEEMRTLREKLQEENRRLRNKSQDTSSHAASSSSSANPAKRSNPKKPR